MITGLLAFLGDVLMALVTKEVTAWLWHLSLWVAKRAAARTSPALIDEYEETYLGELATLQDRPLAAIVVSLRMLRGSRETAQILGSDWPHAAALATKRAIDGAVAALLIVIVAPVLVFSAVAIALTMGSPVLVRQQRLGKDGSRFELLKFRTVRNLQPEAQARTVDTSSSAGFAVYSTLGQLLRSLSFDELPQLFNVLRGDMSLVGPSPRLPEYEDAYPQDHARDIRPGIAGLSQISEEHRFEDMVRLDGEYAREWSLGLDLRLLLKTIPAVFQRRRDALVPRIIARRKSLAPPRRALVAVGIVLAVLFALRLIQFL